MNSDCRVSSEQQERNECVDFSGLCRCSSVWQDPSLTTAVAVTVNDSAPFALSLERDYTILLELDLPPKSIHSVIFERPEVEGDRQSLTE